MSTKSRNDIAKIKASFQKLMNFKDDSEEIDHLAHMISFAFLSEIEKILNDRNLKKNELAALIDVSPSFISQLYQGNKMVSTTVLAKLQKALKIKYKISAIADNNQHSLDENSIYENEELIIEVLNKKSSLTGCWLFHKHFEEMDSVYKSSNESTLKAKSLA